MEQEKNVYPPSEDTFLLMDALSQDRDWIRKLVGFSKYPPLVLEIGSGSGQVMSFIEEQILDEISCIYFATDINRDAAVATKSTSSKCDVVITDLVECFEMRFQNLVDILVFNPPYVPTDDQEYQQALENRDISASWAGGRDGRQVLDRLLLKIEKLMSKRGLFYLVVLDSNKPDSIIASLEALKFQSCTVLQRKAGIENLQILRFSRETYES